MFRKVKFLFKPPKKAKDTSTGGYISILMGALSSRLVQEERTRCVHPDGRAENVAEHSLMLAKVAPELARTLYPELDPYLVAYMATLHDDLEAYVGDTPTDTIANPDLDAKEEKEKLALQQLAKDFADLPGYVEGVREYEAQSTPEARFVRAVDKLMVVLIHLPNKGAVIKDNYTLEDFLESERVLVDRYSYKYNEFEKIKAIRLELAQHIADHYLPE